MTQDRYAVNHSLYILGMFSLLACVMLVVFSLYILPHVVWGIVYDVPLFIIAWQNTLIEEQLWVFRDAGWYIWSMFFIPGVCLGVVSYFISHKLEAGLKKPLADKSLHLAQEEQIEKKQSFEAWRVFLILSAVTLFFVLILWLI